MYKTTIFKLEFLLCNVSEKKHSQAIQKFTRVWIDTDQSEKRTVTPGVRKVQTVYKTATIVEYFDVIGLYAKKLRIFCFQKTLWLDNLLPNALVQVSVL